MENFIVTKKLNKWIITGDSGGPWAHHGNLGIDPTCLPQNISYDGKVYAFSSDNGILAQYVSMEDKSPNFVLLIKEGIVAKRDRLAIKRLNELMVGADQDTVEVLAYAIRRIQGKKS